MSSKTSANAIRLFVEKVNSSDIRAKQNELKKTISGPLALSREKLQILESNEAISVLSRIDGNYSADLKRSVTRIFYEQLEAAILILDNIDSSLKELQDILDTTGQRISNERRRSLDVSFVSSMYEDARSVLVFLKLKTNIYRSCLDLSLDEPAFKLGSVESKLEIDEGEFLLNLSKLETSSLMISD